MLTRAPLRPSGQAEHHRLIPLWRRRAGAAAGGGAAEAPDVHLDGRQSARRPRMVRRGRRQDRGRRTHAQGKAAAAGNLSHVLQSPSTFNRVQGDRKKPSLTLAANQLLELSKLSEQEVIIILTSHPVEQQMHILGN